MRIITYKNKINLSTESHYYVFKSSFYKFLFSLFIVLTVGFSFAVAKEESNNSTASDLAPLLKGNFENEVPTLFEGVVSVQNRAKKKSNNFLLYPYYAADFSDTPYSMWAPNLSLGYAFGEFFEFYVNFASSFSNQERFLSKQMKKYTLDGGGQLVIDIEKAKSQVGLEINWAPIYGKDSWGPTSVIRSDTFFTLGLYSIEYETQRGSRAKIGIGKTFFISNFFNVRLTAALSGVQYASSTGDKILSMVGYGDMGFVFYF